jgi:hypothetical protein
MENINSLHVAMYRIHQAITDKANGHLIILLKRWAGQAV